ncbi:MAG: helix-turn-helix transcriptional regulator [Clostridia bacterium]|nr:helix-turn-helix transcriptional regulator [Clostridia bacterium]
MMIFKRLRELRREKGLSQAEVAAILGVDRRTYSSYETGVNSINAQTLIKLSSIYSASVDYMLGLSDTRKK